MIFSLGMDIGSKNTLISDKKGSILYSDLSCAAFELGRGQLIACGASAEDYRGRQDAAVIDFMERGVTANIYAASAMLSSCMKKLLSPALLKPNVIAAVPSRLSDTGCRALCECLRLAGAHKIGLISAPVCAAVGLDLDIREHASALAVIGSDVCSFGVVSAGCEIAARTVLSGLRDMDEAIALYIRRKHNILISRRTAEAIRHAVGCAEVDKDDCGTWQGRSLAAGQSRSFEICSSETAEVFSPTLNRILDTVEAVLDTVPPEIMAEIPQSGIQLVGGGAMLRGLDRMFTQKLGIPTVPADEALTCIARGAGLLTSKNLRKELGILYLYEGNS